jgi:hypothetical protein
MQTSTVRPMPLARLGDPEHGHSASFDIFLMPSTFWLARRGFLVGGYITSNTRGLQQH